MAEQLISEEKSRGKPRSLLSVYMIAVIVGLAIWAAIYYVWLVI